MSASDSRYFNSLLKLYRKAAPEGSHQAIQQANELLDRRLLPDGVAALVFGLTAAAAEESAEYFLQISRCEKALSALNSGKTSEASRILSGILDDVLSHPRRSVIYRMIDPDMGRSKK